MNSRAGTASNQSPWSKVAKGIWKRKVGRQCGRSYLKMSGCTMSVNGLESMPEAAVPFSLDDIAVRRIDGGMLLSVPCAPSEKLFGLGLNFKKLEVQRTVRRLHSDHFGGIDNGRTHAPVPFYVSSAGYGVFVDLARYLDVHACSSNRKESQPEPVDRFPVKPDGKVWTDVQGGASVEIALPGPGAEVYLLAGPTMLDVVRRFNLLCGGGCLPPIWGLGFWHRLPAVFNDDDALEEVAAFEAKGFPLDVLGLEPGWHSASYPCSYEWNPERFPDPRTFVSALSSQKIRVNLWENPYAAPDSPFGRAIAPFSGDYAAGWGGFVPDYSLSAARTLFVRHRCRTHLEIGVAGYKLDECDGYDKWLWPDHAKFPSGLSGEEMRQLYGVLYQRAANEAARAAGCRTYGLTRASNAGANSFPFVLYSDYYDQRDFVTALCSASFCGMLWTPETRTAKNGEEWLRRFQATCFSPLAMLNAWSDGLKPWSFEEVESAVKESVMLRMSIIPYLYSSFAEYRAKGIPPFRAMALEEGFFLDNGQGETAKLDSVENPYACCASVDVKDQYMIGPSLLAAPLFPGERVRKIALPAGAWFDFYTGEFAGSGPGWMELEVAPHDSMPLLVRDGGIIPLAPASVRVPSSSSPVALEVRHYGNADGFFDLYDDDGESYDYEKNGNFSWTRLSAQRDSAGIMQTGERPISVNESWLWKGFTWHFMCNGREKGQEKANKN